ncbi:hypothetical protein DESPIG_01823 [Desulfovibrio piger ATCC 29098]|uniref:Uncharacterized protein n=1 Tax=Desulfovibrio piger ATCC 29098 TaxID=411464 RepID=B6WUR2_9BACT|nr:hypothetical protein DESPIG_01823 [Desulfovibrio piger ATCC 29098]
MLQCGADFSQKRNPGQDPPSRVLRLPSVSAILSAIPAFFCHGRFTSSHLPGFSLFCSADGGPGRGASLFCLFPVKQPPCFP